MPDRNTELLAADKAQRVKDYERGLARYHAENPHAAAHLTRSAIDGCDMCDEDGYRGMAVCDHQEHARAAKRGVQACQAELAKRDGR